MAHSGTLHAYTKRLTAFQHAPPSPTSQPSNIILWIGGLGDGPLAVHYPTMLASSLPPSWTLAEVLLRSAYDGWGTGSLARDARELGRCVAYFKTQVLPAGAKVVLMGHSTGCQDIMEYLVGAGHAEREGIDGAILQAGVSDREAFASMADEDPSMGAQIAVTVELARQMVERGDGQELLPRKGNPVMEVFGAPCTAYRAYSLLAKGGDDDYFSSDLGEEVLRGTFGKVPQRTRLMLLWGSEDPYVPKELVKEEILGRFARIAKEGGARVDEENGGVVKGATHNLNGDPKEVVQDLVGRVVGFLEGV